MYIETERFGQIDLDECRVINFPFGLPGFEELKNFIILEVDESKPLYWLQSADNGHICLPVIIPFEFMDDYYVEIRDSELADLKIQSKDDLMLMNVVVIPEDITGMTANLAAPIIVNAKEGLAKQIIIDSKDLPIRFPVYEPIMMKLKGGQTDAGTVAEEG